MCVVCPELARYRLPPTRLRYGRPADRYRIERAEFLGRIWEGGYGNSYQMGRVL